MTVLEIKKYPDEFLKNKAQPIEEITEDIHRLIADMAETMYAEPGVGLAAIQVGSLKSLIVYDISQVENERNLQVFINPRIVDQEGSVLSENEGCLSVPDFRADVNRYLRVRVEGIDETGSIKIVDTEGFPAIVLQHEIDHLNGILFIDRISALKRNLYKKRVQKQLKNV